MSSNNSKWTFNLFRSSSYTFKQSSLIFYGDQEILPHTVVGNMPILAMEEGEINFVWKLRDSFFNGPLRTPAEVDKWSLSFWTDIRKNFIKPWYRHYRKWSLKRYKRIIFRFISFFIVLTIFSVSLSFKIDKVNFLISTERYKKFIIFFDKFTSFNL